MMKKVSIVIISFLLLFCACEVYALAIKVYDEYGNRVGTYRKIGDKYEFYDFYDRKVDTPSDIIKNAPDNKTLINTVLYNEYMLPIGFFGEGFNSYDYGNYPRRYYRNGIRHIHRRPYIVRPNARKTIMNTPQPPLNPLYPTNHISPMNPMHTNIHTRF